MEQKQYVIIFSTAYLPFLGGAELAIKEITDRVHEFSFALITARLRRDLPTHEHIGNVEVFRVGIGVPLVDKLLVGIVGMMLARRLMCDRAVCLFWSVMASYAAAAPALLKFFRMNNDVPLLVTLQEGDSEAHIARGRWGLVGLGWRFILGQADHVQVISRYLNGMARAYGYAGDITIVPNGVDTKHNFQFPISNFQIPVSPRILGKAGTNTETQIKNRKKQIIITVSRLVEKNGVDTLIRAFVEVHKKYPLAKLHIVGDGTLRAELEVLARALGVGKAVTFFGEVPHEKISEYHADARMFVRLSRSEGLGTAFLEAMADGLPVIGTSVGGIVDFLQDGQTGLFCKVDDQSDCAAKIEMLLDDEELYKKLQENGRRLVEDQYAWDSIAERMQTIFKSLCVL